MKLSSTANYCANLIQVPITILNENVNLIIKTKTKKDIIIIIKDNKHNIVYKKRKNDNN